MSDNGGTAGLAGRVRSALESGDLDAIRGFDDRAQAAGRAGVPA